MACQEVAFAAARCRIQIEPALDREGARGFAATMSVIDESSRTIRPLVALDGRPAEVVADSEPHALHQAIAFLEPHLGSSLRIASPRGRTTHLSLGDPITVAE